MRRGLRGRDQFIGVDRLDYSKGLLRRMDAFGRYLEMHPKAHGKVTLLTGTSARNSTVRRRA